jgi:hypothetical protein
LGIVVIVGFALAIYFVVKKSNDNTSLRNAIMDLFKEYNLTDDQNKCATNYITSNYTIAQMISWINQLALSPKIKNIPASAKPYIIDKDDANALSRSCGIH